MCIRDSSEAELRSLYQEAEQADTPWIADRNARFRLYDESCLLYTSRCV